MRLSVKEIDSLALPAGKSDHIEWDDELGGFGLRLREGGSRHWVFQYKLGGKHRRITFENTRHSMQKGPRTGG